jgi:hypothetical protein
MRSLPTPAPPPRDDGTSTPLASPIGEFFRGILAGLRRAATMVIVLAAIVALAAVGLGLLFAAVAIAGFLVAGGAAVVIVLIIAAALTRK